MALSVFWVADFQTSGCCSMFRVRSVVFVGVSGVALGVVTIMALPAFQQSGCFGWSRLVA